MSSGDTFRNGCDRSCIAFHASTSSVVVMASGKQFPRCNSVGFGQVTDYPSGIAVVGIMVDCCVLMLVANWKCLFRSGQAKCMFPRALVYISFSPIQSQASCR